MQTQRRRPAGELAFTAMLALISAFLLWTAYKISGFSSLTSAGAFPMVATAVMLAASVINFVNVSRQQVTEAQPGEGLSAKFWRELAPPVLLSFTLVIALYMFFLQRLGFLISSYLFLVVSMWLLGSRRWLLSLGVSAVCLGAIYLIFQTIFTVVLPSGTWLQGAFK